MSENKKKLFKLMEAIAGDQNYETDKLIQKVNGENEELAIYTKHSYEKEVSVDNETKEIGSIKHWKKYDKDDKKAIGVAVYQTGEKSGMKFNVYNNKPALIKGYANVGDNNYLTVAKSPLFIIILLILLLLCGCLGIGSFLIKNNPAPTTPHENLAIADGQDWDGELAKGEESEAIAEQTEIPGYANLFVSKESPNINLINPTENTVYFKYIISENDKVLYETDLIKPDKMLTANLYDILTDGEHVLSFQINTYDIETQDACNGATQTVNIIKK